MAKWKITIKGTVLKILKVNAKTQEEAIETAHQLFTTEQNGDVEKYNEEVIQIEKV